MSSKEWVLVTGAASGIGAELCRLFARDGSNIVLLDRNQSGLQKMRTQLAEEFGTETLSLLYDLSVQEAPEQIYQEVQERGVEVDVLVNNAGFGTFGNFWETDVARDRALINVNIMAPMLLTKFFLPGMVKRRRGRILNVGSVSGFLASPYASTYYSSKAFLLSFSQSVATSLRGRGVTVTVVCPGPTYTAFNWHSVDDGSAPPQRKRFQMDASEVAAQAYRGMRRGQMVVIPGTSNKLLALLAKLLPRRLALWLLTMGQRKAN
ncbi:MAG TPA: SDR family oxidoreductase [Abditibacteriaceae bacterium]